MSRKQGSTMQLESETPQGDLTTRTLAMPADATPAGDIFGVWVLSQMDIASGICAGQRAQGRVVTIAVNAMTFLRPVYVGTCFVRIAPLGAKAARRSACTSKLGRCAIELANARKSPTARSRSSPLTRMGAQSSCRRDRGRFPGVGESQNRENES